MGSNYGAEMILKDLRRGHSAGGAMSLKMAYIIVPDIDNLYIEMLWYGPGICVLK